MTTSAYYGDAIQTSNVHCSTNVCRMKLTAKDGVQNDQCMCPKIELGQPPRVKVLSDSIDWTLTLINIYCNCDCHLGAILPIDLELTSVWMGVELDLL